MLEADLGLESSQKNLELCLNLYEDLKDNERGITQAISWARTSWTQSAKGMAFLAGPDGPTPEDRALLEYSTVSR